MPGLVIGFHIAALDGALASSAFQAVTVVRLGGKQHKMTVMNWLFTACADKTPRMPEAAHGADMIARYSLAAFFASSGWSSHRP